MHVVDRPKAGPAEKPARFSPLKMVARALGARPEGPVSIGPELEPPSATPEAAWSPPVAGDGFVAVMNALLADDSEFPLPPEMAEVDLVGLVQEVHDVFAARAVAEGRALAVSVAPEAAGAYCGDVLRLRQALLNLVAGALKSAPESDIVLTVGWTGEALVFEVAEAEVAVALARLLARRARPGSCRPAQGLGQAMRAALDLGGVMRVNAGVGVEMAIPFARAGQEAAPTIRAQAPAPVSTPRPAAPVRALAPEPALKAEPAAAPPIVEAPAFQPGLRILVAEAHPAQQQQLSAALGGLAVEAVVVAEGQDLVDAWRQERWDMLLVDIDDPTLGGRALIRSIRGAEASARWRPTPILALADARGPDDIDEAFVEMIDGVVVKPVSVAALAEALQAALDVVPAATAPVTFARAAFA